MRVVEFRCLYCKKPAVDDVDELIKIWSNDPHDDWFLACPSCAERAK
jgi:hypothetical protein